MKNVLLIDDEFFFRKAIHHYFQDFNSEFTICGEANNGRDGLRLIQELKPDIALVDITMPLMDGIQMVESARAPVSYTHLDVYKRQYQSPSAYR